MQLTTLAGAVLALALVTGSAAALPGAAPAQADETVPSAGGDTDANASDHPAADRGNASDDARGPPASLPDQVPDFVGEIHDRIGDMLSGDRTGGLGDAISDLTPDGDDAETTSNGPGATATPSA